MLKLVKLTGRNGGALFGTAGSNGLPHLDDVPFFVRTPSIGGHYRVWSCLCESVLQNMVVCRDNERGRNDGRYAGEPRAPFE